MKKEKLKEAFAEKVGGVPDLYAAAPGRIEFIGNHTDYNGGEVLGAAIDREVYVAAASRDDGNWVFSSDLTKTPVVVKANEFDLQTGASSWANYPLGILSELIQAGYGLERGYGFYFASELPVGAGLSSSAAIELATLEAVCALEGISMENREKLLLAQRAENQYVGVPCGILDQSVSCLGKLDHLVHIDCAKVEFERVALPESLHFWIFNTNQKHNLVDSLYSTRHRECHEALEQIKSHHGEVGYLALAGKQVLDCLENPTLLRRARHVISENLRVKSMVFALGAGDLDTVGKLLFESHFSSRDDFENSIPELDTFVSLLEGEQGVIGARLTGGGFGGAAMALTTDAFSQKQAESVLARYLEQHADAETPSVIHVKTGEGSRLI